MDREAGVDEMIDSPSDLSIVEGMSHPSVERLGPPPRDVPFVLRIQLKFGGPLNQVGWGIFGFGTIFFWVFAMNCEILTWFTFSGEKATTQAVVTGSVKTNCKEGHKRIYAIEYWYPAVDVAEKRSSPVVLPSAPAEKAQGCCGRSYSVGRELTPGTQVTVEYLLRDPSVSRVKGLRRTAFGAAAALVALLPLAGLCLLLVGRLKARKACRLLQFGNLADGRLQSKEPTHTRVNRQTVYKLVFEFQASDGLMHTATARTHQTDALEDEAREKIIYEPSNPDCAVIVDALPGAFLVDAQGLIQTVAPQRALAALIIPSLVILGNGVYLLLR